LGTKDLSGINSLKVIVMNGVVKIYVELLDEGTPCRRPTFAEDLGSNKYKVLPTPKYDPENEVWQFIPGAVVRCETRNDSEGEYLYAVEQVN